MYTFETKKKKKKKKQDLFWPILARRLDHSGELYCSSTYESVNTRKVIFGFGKRILNYNFRLDILYSVTCIFMVNQKYSTGKNFLICWYWTPDWKRLKSDKVCVLHPSFDLTCYYHGWDTKYDHAPAPHLDAILIMLSGWIRFICSWVTCNVATKSTKQWFIFPISNVWPELNEIFCS